MCSMGPLMLLMFSYIVLVIFFILGETSLVCNLRGRKSSILDG
uniref:Uncharacterized protein n=1 Tax=Rhizophora mucronata TaxID=61149 RepID=A0A2P2Q9C0_RHIMU